MIELHDDLQLLTFELHNRQLSIATAESCTGGLVASLLTEFPGSSVWFERGFVTYSNLAKQEMLGVEENLLKKYGAVSIEVAEAMALGALKHSTAQVALSITGIAGPDGGSKEKPVGTVCFGFAMHNAPVCSQRILFDNTSRHQIRRDACKTALQEMLKFINCQ